MGKAYELTSVGFDDIRTELRRAGRRTLVLVRGSQPAIRLNPWSTHTAGTRQPPPFGMVAENADRRPPQLKIAEGPAWSYSSNPGVLVLTLHTLGGRHDRPGSPYGARHQDIPAVWYDQPIYYKANRFSVVGPEADVRWPSYAQLLDYELELACVLGKGGVDISVEEAQAHIFGFTIFNDVSARDTQAKEMEGQLGPAKGKDFDTGNVFGPWIVTADELGDPYDLVMVARVNSEEWSRGRSATMHYRFDDLIAYVSRSETLHPGEVLGSGTVGGGCGLELGRFLQPGDVVELEVERIGVLRNRIVKRGGV